eukprot:CAMPEP_0180529696 /NCGR_PEP_ID=MMETSP1036_2-20121128/61517_1 /TAXON_ID=632150 /ORGANISM="Azadinium spinosum, Strain 3D9" /LENGTH=52 /DNA_ID=CAMNT_0022543435 /DNA_START=462 /DNA_END=617 /DNA_ORIENTATION=+
MLELGHNSTGGPAADSIDAKCRSRKWSKWPMRSGANSSTASVSSSAGTSAAW